jgi:hypothetical protein
MISKLNALVLTGTLAAGIFVGQAMAAQPHMVAALDALRTARSELPSALANKGGHRVKAIASIDQAIEETNAGIAAGRGN